MQPASKLLTLCFLILMGTELTQVGFLSCFHPPTSPPPFLSLSPQRHFLLNLESAKENWSRRLQLCAPHPRAPPVCSAHGAGGSSGPWGGEQVGGGGQETGPQNWGTRGCPSVVPSGSFGGDTTPARPTCGESCDVGLGVLGGSGTLAGVQRSSGLPVPGPRRDATGKCGGGSLLITPSTPAPHLGVALLILGDI